MDDLETIISTSQYLKLLYVEDNEQVRNITLMVLEDFFNEVIVAVDGEDGFEKFQDNDIDLIITDINMPRLNGLEMTEKIRQIDSSVPILVLSAYNESSYFIDSIKLGIEGYLLKPIDLEQFISVLRKTVYGIKLKKEAQESLHFLQQYQKAANVSAIVSKTDLKGIITYVNEDFCEISEYSEDELLGKNHNIVRHPDNPSSVFKEMWNTIKVEKKIWKGIVRNLSKSGKSYYVDSTVIPIIDAQNNIVEYISLRKDITNIMNPRKQFLDAIASYKEPLVAYMKLEDFDTLEEFYSNAIVEEIQDKVAIYLESHIPINCKFNKVYQLGNGEYAMTREKFGCKLGKSVFIKDLKEYQEDIRNRSISIANLEYDMSVIISLAFEDDNVLESAKLGLRSLLKTKQDFIISNNFAQIEHEKAQKNIETIAMIKQAIRDSKIISYFQTIVNNKTKEIEKYESLVRLIDADGKVLSPCFFLETSKKGKYYSQITAIVLKHSFDALKRTDKEISINLSALDIEDKVTRNRIFKLLEQNRKDASRVVFELLEDESIKDFKIIIKFIEKVKKLGAKIAIDDFGAGYSNFERLLDYQPDILKIDGSLVKEIETNSYSFSIVKTIVSFAKEQNILTVAEFVENEAIFNILNDLGVDYSQGYYFSKPEELA